MNNVELHCYRYVLVGLGEQDPQLGGKPCTEPPCTPGYPGIAKNGEWELGYKQIQPSDPNKQFRPRAISAIDFASEELAKLWLTETKSGTEFQSWYGQIILVRVYNG